MTAGAVRWRRMVIGLALLLVLVAALFQISRAPCFQLIGEVVCRVETSERVVALSFDDGPTALGVDTVLKELEPRGLKATFFLIGSEIAARPEQARRLVDAGMELGNHTWSHQTMLLRSPAFYAGEVQSTDAHLDAVARNNRRLFRPPYGKRLLGLPQAAHAAGYTTVTWDVADDVGGHRTPRAYADDILARVRPGSIVLMHPMYRGNTVEREALPLVLDGLAARGFRVVTVGELLALRETAR